MHLTLSKAQPKERFHRMLGGGGSTHWKHAVGLMLGVLLLATHSGAAPQTLRLGEAHFPGGRLQSSNRRLRLQASRNQTQAGGVELQKVSKTFVDMSPAELKRTVPELKHLAPADNQDMLLEILKRAGDQVAEFFNNFPNTASTEEVTSMVDSGFKAGAYHSYNRYNYLALVQEGDPKNLLHEYRADDRGKPIQADPKNAVVTSGFIARVEDLDPEFQPDSRFVYLGREVVDEQNTYVVAFAQRPAVARRVARIQFSGQDETAFWQGVAWIDPVAFRILRLRTDIQLPPGYVGTLAVSTEIAYSEVSFKQSGLKLWLPREVTVTGQLNQYHFRNQHRYSDYRLFKVAVEEKRDQP